MNRMWSFFLYQYLVFIRPWFIRPYIFGYEYLHSVCVFIIHHSPWIVMTTLLLEALFLCSQSQIPCQVPMLGIPLVIGMETLLPISEDLICAGISSGPSMVWS